MIKKATTEDLEIIYNMMKESVLYHQKFDIEFYKFNGKVKNEMYEYIRNYLNKKNNFTFIMQKGNDFMGYIRFSYENNFLKLVDMFIFKKYRTQGFGKKLFLDSLKKIDLKKRKKIKLVVDYRNEKAISFYKSLGFKPLTLNMFLENNQNIA